MKAAEIQVGQVYAVKVSGRVVPVKVLDMYERWAGDRVRNVWSCRNEVTGRVIEVKSAQKFRHPVVERSKGHLGFLSGKWEFYKADNGDLYRAPVENPVMPDGRRCGRFEATAATAATALRLAVEAARAERAAETN